MARTTSILALALTIFAGGIALAFAADNGTSPSGQTTQTRTRAAADNGKTTVTPSGDEATAPGKGGAAKAVAVQQTKAVGQSSDFVDNGPRK